MAGLALSAALNLTPAKFDRRWREDGPSALKYITCNDPAGRQQAAAEALGELLQAADGVPGPLQPQYRQQGEALVQRQRRMWDAGAVALRAGWASLQQLGLSSGQVAAVVQKQPMVLAFNWDGEAKQRLLAWVQQELGLSPYDFLTRHTNYATNSVATIAMRADFLRQHSLLCGKPSLLVAPALCSPCLLTIDVFSTVPAAPRLSSMPSTVPGWPHPRGGAGAPSLAESSGALTHK